MNPLFVFLSLCFVFLYSCKFPGKTTSGDNTADSNPYEIKAIELISPGKNEIILSGSNVTLKAQITDQSRKPDSILYLIDGKVIGKTKSVADSIVFNTETLKLGYRNIEIAAYYPDSLRSFDFRKVFIKINKAPEIYTYKILNIYPHDPDAYTQGLVYENGLFYESTGIYKQSTLRKVEQATGKVKQIVGLPPDVFGEGIAVFDGKIIQITWQEQIAFLYNKESLQLINKFYYPVKEGWGLTYNGKNLIMSDGSSTLYFLDKNTFTELGRIEIYDENGPVRQLNELEYINNEIWANIYTTDTIVRINPNNGAVVGKIGLNGLLKSVDIDDNTDVLNGIAYDFERKRIFVTGKNWPKMFEVSIFPKK